MPMGCKMSRMSENRMAASAPMASSAVTATSAARSGVRQSSMKETFSRTARYSRMYLPA